MELKADMLHAIKQMIGIGYIKMKTKFKIMIGIFLILSIIGFAIADEIATRNRTIDLDKDRVSRLQELNLTSGITHTTKEITINGEARQMQRCIHKPNIINKCNLFPICYTTCLQRGNMTFEGIGLSYETCIREGEVCRTDEEMTILMDKWEEAVLIKIADSKISESTETERGEVSVE